MFPPELARKLGAAATAGLTPEDSSDRWSAVMEAAAFSPVRTLVTPAAPPTTITDDLRATALRLGPLLPQIAALLGVEVPAGAPRPKPLRPGPRNEKRKKPARRDGGDAGTPSGQGRGKGKGRGNRDASAQSPAAAKATEQTPADEQVTAPPEPTPTDQSSGDAPASAEAAKVETTDATPSAAPEPSAVENATASDAPAETASAETTGESDGDAPAS